MIAPLNALRKSTTVARSVIRAQSGFLGGAMRWQGPCVVKLSVESSVRNAKSHEVGTAQRGT